MSKKNYSPKLYKVSSIILYILGAISLLIGIPTFPVGGFIFVIIGVICFVFATSYRKVYRTTTTKKKNTNTGGLRYGLYYVYVNKNSKVYHDDVQCRSINPSFEMITEDEAKQKGLTPCKHCHIQ